MADTALQGFATIAASTDTLKIGVAEECKTKKYEESNMICPSKGMLLLYGTAELVDLTVNPNTVKTDRPPDWTDGNNPTNELLTTEGEAWQDGSNELILNEPRFISRDDGMSFNMAEFTSTGESDAEMSVPLPLGY